MSAGFVYLLAADNGLTKIGRSKNPQKRLRDQTGAAVAVVLIHQIQTDNMVWLEGYLHGRYAASRKRGEWFTLSPQDLAELTAVHEWNRPDNWVKPPSSAGRFELRVPSAWFRRVQRQAERLGISLSDYIRRATTINLEQDEATDPTLQDD